MYRLVIIDDEYIVIEGIKALLARAKLPYEVVGWAYDGIHALEVIREQKPDMVITDIRIPGLDGLSLIEAAKEECPDTLFIVISGYMEFEYARRALSLGVKGYIDKPISIDKLKEVFDRIEKERKRLGYEEEDKYKKLSQAHEELKEAVNESIRELTGGDAENFQKACKRVFCQQKHIFEEMQEFQREMYKYLCLICDIFGEKQKQVSREFFVSYPEMAKLQTTEEMIAYGERIVSDIGKHIAADQTGSSHRVILELLEYINAHYNEDIGLNELAVRARMSTAYLSVLFKTEVGTSYVKYLTELRIRQAKKFLKDGYKVNEVSELVGYSNYRYFCDIFKKHEGQTPSEYKAAVWKSE